MKHCRYYPEFDAREYGAAEKRADRYWQKRKDSMERGEIMPQRLERPCRAYLCPNTTSNHNGYCDEHQALEVERRGSASSRGYDHRWARFRAEYLRVHPLCVDCESEHRLTPSSEVHHIHKLRDYPGEKYKSDNLMALCHQCHSRRTVRGE